MKEARMNSPAKVVLGVDIGGTNTKFGYVDRAGTCLAGSSIPTDAHQPAEVFFGRLHKSSQSLLASLSQHYQVIGIGVGAPNANYYKGTIEHPPNLGWEFVDVRSQLK